MSLDPQLVASTAALLQRSRTAAAALAPASTASKNAFLTAVADLLRERANSLAAANQQDIDRARANGRNAAFIDRLSLGQAAIAKLADAVLEIRALPDPVGITTSGARRPNGLHVSKVRIPLGVIGMVYESRPNVTIDAGCLCIKAGNAVVLRGGSDAKDTNAALMQVMRDALTIAELPVDAAAAPASPGHDGIRALVACVGGLDVVIPRGGTGLIDEVNRWAKVPVIQHYEGVCHLFVHEAADLDEATRIIVNAKAQRPGVCNALEGVLVDRAIADQAVPVLVQALTAAGVEVRACEAAHRLAPDTTPATEADLGREYLDLIVLLRVVDGLDGAIEHIQRYGSGHTEGILTTDLRAANRFVQTVQASCVMVNASTRFNDGGCLGLGAEIGISTSKLHAYGPMGLESLTTQKYVVMGDGHVRT